MSDDSADRPENRRGAVDVRIWIPGVWLGGYYGGDGRLYDALWEKGGDGSEKQRVGQWIFYR